MNDDQSSDPVLAKFGVAELVVNGDEKIDIEFMRSARKLMEANCLDLKNIEQFEPLGLTMDEPIIQRCFHGRNAVLARVLEVSNEEEHKEINIIVITGIGLSYNVSERNALEDSLGAKIYDIADLIDAHNECGKDSFRSKVFSLVRNKKNYKYTDEQIIECKEIIAKVEVILTELTGEPMIGIFMKQAKYQGIYSEKNYLIHQSIKRFVADLTYSAANLGATSKDLGEMISRADNIKKIGRAVHSEAIYTALLLEHMEWRNLYFFSQRDMCPGCDCVIQNSLNILQQDKTRKLLVLSAIPSNILGDGVYTSGANYEIYFPKNYIVTLNIEDYPNYMKSERSLWEKPKHPTGDNVLRVRIPALAAFPSHIHPNLLPYFDSKKDRLILKRKGFPIKIWTNINGENIVLANTLKDQPTGYTYLQEIMAPPQVS